MKEAILLGIGWGHIKHPRDEELEYETEMEAPGRPTPGRYNAGMMAVVPAWKIADLLDDPKEVAVRRKSEDEFERFEDLTRKLVNVPKKELDEKRREDES